MLKALAALLISFPSLCAAGQAWLDEALSICLQDASSTKEAVALLSREGWDRTPVSELDLNAAILVDGGAIQRLAFSIDDGGKVLSTFADSELRTRDTLSSGRLKNVFFLTHQENRPSLLVTYSQGGHENTALSCMLFADSRPELVALAADLSSIGETDLPYGYTAWSHTEKDDRGGTISYWRAKRGSVEAALARTLAVDSVLLTVKSSED